jgi:hypothetical protein
MDEDAKDADDEVVNEGSDRAYDEAMTDYDKKEIQKLMPENDIDLQMMMTDPNWGQEHMNPVLVEKFKKVIYTKSEEGKKIKEFLKREIWSGLNIFQRDVRLANLKENELALVRYDLELASDMLASNMIVPALYMLTRPINILETSQSRDGFLRKLNRSIIRHNQTSRQEPPKRGLFGGSKQQNY